jgi:hypothetical protein
VGENVGEGWPGKLIGDFEGNINNNGVYCTHQNSLIKKGYINIFGVHSQNVGGGQWARVGSGGRLRGDFEQNISKKAVFCSETYKSLRNGYINLFGGIEKVWVCAWARWVG